MPSAVSPAFNTPLPPQLDADAAALLEESGGDVEKARTSFMGYTLAFLEDEMPELYEALKTEPSRADAHAALVELTWDSIAAFMPVTHSSSPTPAAAMRMTAIARAALPADGADASVLDVGCGNGVLYPFLTTSGMAAAAYRGIDVSSRMIDLAQRAHGDSGATFEDGSFADEVASGARYDTIIFNGVLEFFDDQEATLKAAAAMLSDKEDARIIVSNIGGARGVRADLGNNPSTVLNTMPLLALMQQTAATMGMQVVLPSFFGEELEAIEKALEDFYLVILRRTDAEEPPAAEEAAAPEIELPEMFNMRK